MSHEPSIRVSTIINHLEREGLAAELSLAAEGGNMAAKTVMDTYRIFSHLRTPLASQFLVAAYDEFAIAPLRNMLGTPGVRQWINSDLEARHREDHTAVNPDASAPWQAANLATLWVENGPTDGFVAAMLPGIENGSSYSSEELLVRDANCTLVAHVQSFAGKLDQTQTLILQSMNLMANGQEPGIAALESQTAKLDQLLESFHQEMHNSTVGPWTYNPDGMSVYLAYAPDRPMPVAVLGDPKHSYSAAELCAIHANGELIAATPQLTNQLGSSYDCIRNAVNALQAGNREEAFKQLHTAALSNDPVLRAARGDQLNPHSVEPIPGTPGFERWINSNLAIIETASTIQRRSPQQAATYFQPEQQSGIYRGTIAATNQEFYLQHRSDDTVVAHWKGSFAQPLTPGKEYTISYNQGKATAREIEPAKAAAHSQER